MKPRFEPISYEVKHMLEKADRLNSRLDNLSKAKCDCGKSPCECKKGEKCDCGKTPCQCVKKAKCDCGKSPCECKNCPKCGSKMKYAMGKSGCMKMGCGGKMEKGEEGGGSFTIGDAQRAKQGKSPLQLIGETSSAPVDDKYKNHPGRNDDIDDALSEEDMDNEQDKDAAPSGETLPLSEGPSRQQKRGMQGRGVAVKKPGFRSSEEMPMDDASAKTMAKSGDAGSQPTFNTTFSTTPQDIAFVSESGGQTRNAGYSTNQHLLDSEDVANKGATSVSVSLEKLASMLNPHEGGGSSRLDDNGVLKSVCEQCGGNQYSGCRGNCPNKKNLN